MRWPWSKPVETRESYTESVVSAALYDATNTTGVRALASLEIAAGLWARSLSVATVRPEGAALGGLTPDVLGDIGRRLCATGEALYLLDVRGGRVSLLPISHYDVSGSFDPATWVYRITLAGPTSSTTRRISGDGILHFRYSTDPERPWKGLSPLGRASETAALAANLERMLRDEAGGPVGSFLTLPAESGPVDDDDDDPLATVRSGIGSARGAPVLIETNAGGHGDRGNAPLQDWKPNRFGAAWPAPVLAARGPIGESILAACGVPPSLVQANSDGTAQREAHRRFYATTTLPLGRIVETELRTKLDRSAKLEFTDLAATDLNGRARAFRSLVGKDEKMSAADAREIVGW